ncbi:hypothetical protein KCU99_g17, partial [Aureobasidium melanogenum]
MVVPQLDKEKGGTAENFGFWSLPFRGKALLWETHSERDFPERTMRATCLQGIICFLSSQVMHAECTIHSSTERLEIMILFPRASGNVFGVQMQSFRNKELCTNQKQKVQDRRPCLETSLTIFTREQKYRVEVDKEHSPRVSRGGSVEDQTASKQVLTIGAVSGCGPSLCCTNGKKTKRGLTSCPLSDGQAGSRASKAQRRVAYAMVECAGYCDFYRSRCLSECAVRECSRGARDRGRHGAKLIEASSASRSEQLSRFDGCQRVPSHEVLQLCPSYPAAPAALLFLAISPYHSLLRVILSNRLLKPSLQKSLQKQISRPQASFTIG